MSILRFRVSFEDYDDIHRDIDLKDDHTFADLLAIILQSIQFDNKHNSEFFLADHNWRKGDRIGEVNAGDSKGKLAETALINFIDDPHQRFLFTYDLEARWNFTIELIRLISSPDGHVNYPRLVVSAGTAPVQYKENLIIPVREQTESRSRRRKSDTDDDALMAIAAMDDDEDALSEGGEISDSTPEEISLDLPADLDLETDNEIAKLAEEFNNTTEVGEDESHDDDEYGNDDDEFGGDDDEYNSGYGSGRDEYDE